MATTNNNSLPIGYDKIKDEKPYLKLSKLPQGEYRFRIVQRPIAGWIDWLDNKPHRFRPESKPASSFDPEKKIRSFWVLHVWDYAQEGLYVMEITQIGIIKALENYALNEDWGDLTSFDFKIKKEGTGMDTEYTVIPVPHKAMSPTIKNAVSSTKIRLEALYEGKDPWKDLEPTTNIDPSKHTMLSDHQVYTIQGLIEDIADDDYIAKLMTYMEVEDLTNIAPKDYDRTIRSMQAKLKEREHGKVTVG